MATYTLSPGPGFQFFDDSGNPLSGGKVTTYLAGTSTLATVYQTSSGTAHANPIILDAGGRCTIYLEPGQAYKFTWTTSADVAVDSQDNIAAVPASTVNLDFQGTFGVAADPGDLMYLSDGSGSLTAGSWYKSDADLTYGSVTPELAFAVNAVSSGASGTLRKGGTITLTGPLTLGAPYYVSATAGGVTATAPVNARYVGQAQTTTVLVINPELANSASDSVVIDPKIKSLCDGRLTLTTAVPVTTADVTAATTVYFALYGGNQIGLYNGTRWQQFTIAQLSIAVPGTTVTMYDVFVDYNSGTPALAVTAWTNDTTRATALTTQDGVLVLTGTLGKRYVGSFRTTGVSGQTEDSVTKRFVWNYYNRVPRPVLKRESTATWEYSTATMRQANGAATNQVEIVNGFAEEAIVISLQAMAGNATANVNLGVTIGEDSTTAGAAAVAGGQTVITSGEFGAMSATLCKQPAVGYHYYAWLESGGGSVTTTWYGSTLVTNGSANGLVGMWRG